jgi:hypothetical protein
MPFATKRLRVQIPCDALSVTEDPVDIAAEARCCFQTHANCGSYLKTPNECDSGQTKLKMVPLEPFPERFFVDADYLPLVRKELEARLEHMRREAAVTEAHIEGQLKELAVAERALEAHNKRKQ